MDSSSRDCLSRRAVGKSFLISTRPPLSVGAALLVLAAVHFVNLLDFMMVMPLGPDFAAALGIPMSHLGIVGGSYTASATVVGILGSLLLDRWERRSALTVSVCGLGLATMTGALATGTASLVATRMAAGKRPSSSSAP